MRLILFLLLLVWSLPTASAQRTYSCQFSTDGEWIVFLVEEEETFIKIVEISTGQIIRSMGPVKWMSFAELSPDNKWIVTNRLLDDRFPHFYKDWEMTIWNMTGQIIKSYNEHNDGTFIAGGKWLLAHSFSVNRKKSKAMIYEPNSGKLLYTRNGIWKKPVYKNGQIAKWKKVEKKVAQAILDSIQQPYQRPSFFESTEEEWISPDGKWILEFGKSLKIYKAATGKLVHDIIFGIDQDM